MQETKRYPLLGAIRIVFVTGLVSPLSRSHPNQTREEEGIENHLIIQDKGQGVLGQQKQNAKPDHEAREVSPRGINTRKILHLASY